MVKVRTAVLLGVILLLGGGMRLTAVTWDGLRNYHPDERYIAWVATSIEWPAMPATALSPTLSSFNPYYWPADADSPGIEVLQDTRRDFAYGHLPLYLGVAATRLVEKIGPGLRDQLPESWSLTQNILNGADRVEFKHLTAVSRALTGLFDTATLLLIFLLGRRLFGANVGLLAAALLAVTVLHIQVAHFFVVDPYLTFFVVLALLLMVYAAGTSGRRRRWVFTAVAATVGGLAVGAKFAAVVLIVPLATFVWLSFGGPPRRRLLIVMGMLLLGFTAFAVTNPFALLDTGCEAITPAATVGPIRLPALDWRSCFLANVGQQSAMVQGSSRFPFTRQYEGTWPYLYFVEMLFKWGQGPLLAIAGGTGLIWAAGRVWRLRNRARESALTLALPLLWTVAYFTVTGNFYVKFMRYLLPLTPFLALFAAAWLYHGWPRRWRGVAIGTVLLPTALYALTFVNLYATPHPWETASRWLHANVPPGATIATELWDEPLPTSMTIAGEWMSRSRYDNRELTWLSGSQSATGQSRFEANVAGLAAADYLVLASNRVYDVVPRLPDVYAREHTVHARLFDGSMGYEVVYVGDRSPRLGAWRLRPDPFAGSDLAVPPAVADYLAATPSSSWGRADESFTVYDQPFVIIMANREHLSEEALLALLESDITP